MCWLLRQGLTVADIAATRNIQETTVLSYLAEAIAAGYPYAWERFEIADSTLAAVRQAACAYAAEQRSTASVEVAADSAAQCGFAEPPAGLCDKEAASGAFQSTGARQEESVVEEAAVTAVTAALAPQLAPAPAVLQPLGRSQSAEQQPCQLSPVIVDSAMDVSAQQCTSCSRTEANGAAGVLSADAAACIADLVSQRESLRPLKEHLLVDINFGVLRLALAHLLRLSAGHTP